MNLKSLISKTSDETSTYEFCVAKRLVFTDVMCSDCSRPMHVENGKRRHGLNRRWRCSVRSCRKSVGLYAGSLFEGSHMLVSECLYIMYLHSMKLTKQQIAFQTEKRKQKVIDFIGKCYNTVDSIDVNNVLGMLGGEDDTIEVDETHIFSRRDGRGRIIRGERYWVIGAISRSTKQVRCFVTRSRSRVICEQFILKNVQLGSRIMTDCWRGYSRPNEIGHTHQTVNHSVNFVDAENPTIHTQNIERLWRSMKEELRCINTYQDVIKQVNRFVLKNCEHFLNDGERFDFYLDINKI